MPSSRYNTPLIVIVGSILLLSFYYFFLRDTGIKNEGSLAAATAAASQIADKDNSSPIMVYPNPFMETTQVSFYNDKTQPVYVDVVDIQGRIIEVLENGTLTVGNKNYTFVPKSDETSTYYYVRIKLGDKMTTKSIQKITGLGGSNSR